ncbi:amidase family protein [Arthrobacter sp. NicSoilC12]|uniref:amidase family protein n=1 Tax=Arthrobacter sp. NicSoilC12 TaxID=2831001 RepID=UPI001CC492E8|nr:amidase family protein [Arthrobacter sp. NicSoilC12]GIU56648.1 amidase [Arthrobacter sp. NicSoilC12]
MTAQSPAPRPASPQQADPTVWREVGDPLLPATGTGPLTGMSVAVKDLFTLEGHPVGAGNEEWLAQRSPETTTAPAAAALMAAGAAVAGIARTDEFAYSLAGTNAHYGTPPNPMAPDRISGGSSSGSASAVALGQATIGLGTDTGGSIRVPSAYQGLFGIRTTHGAVSTAGLLPLAPSFDAVGWMTRDAATLAAVGSVLLPPHEPAAPLSDGPFAGALFSPGLLALAEPGVVHAVEDSIDAWAGSAVLPALDWAGLRTDELPAWLAAFQTVQGYEAWQQHGPWIRRHWSALGADVAARFRTASRVERHQAEAARDVLRAARQHIRSVVGGALLVLPSASSVAPLLAEASLGGEAIERVRRSTMQLTCIAGIAGLPAVNVPLSTDAGLPCGVSIVGPAHRDAELITVAIRLSESLLPHRKRSNA